MKPKLENGVCLSKEHDGLLTLSEEQMITLIHKDPIKTKYHVEQVPFARGKFASVRRCTEQSSGIMLAAKFIRKRRRAMDQRHEIIHEMAVLQLAHDCQHIVRLHEAYESSNEMVLVLEMACGGELQHIIDDGEVLEESEVRRLMKQILEGLIFLHDRNIAHLDLKPQNLLLTGPYPGCDLKLCDFGISRVIQSGIDIREIMGTPDYVAPEILSYEPISLATDIWSIGILAYVLLTGHSPFAGDSKQETFCNISHGHLDFPSDLFQDVSNQAKEFIKATLVVEATERLNAYQCLSHPWLSSAKESIPPSVKKETDSQSIPNGDVQRNGAHNNASPAQIVYGS